MPPKRVGRPPGSKNKPKLNSSNVREKTPRTHPEDRLCKARSVKVEKITLCDTEDPEDEEELMTHNDLSIEHDKVLYSCKQCSFKNFKFEKHYEQHILLEHSTAPGSVACDKCNAVCPSKKVLEQHVKKVHDRSTHQCKYCFREFVRRAHVLRHMAQKGCDGSGVSLYPCEICSATFSRKDNLVVHLRTMHINRKMLKCKQPNCDFITKNFTKLIRHWHSTHAEVPHRFECDICGKATMSRAAMTKHLEIHGEKKYACEACGYETYTIEVMRRHVLTHVADKPYKCEQCGESYIQRGQLDRHMEKHLGHTCSTCKKEFKQKAYLIIHNWKEHKGYSELQCHYNCEFSEKVFKSEEELVAHLGNHITSKMYSCEVCHKKFQSEGNMRRHLTVHSLDRPRRCMYCVSARAYVRGEQLVRHVRKFHPNVFATHRAHVQEVLGANRSSERVTKSEMDSILNLLDAESDRILEGCGGRGGAVLYAGMQTDNSQEDSKLPEEDDGPLMSEEVLAENLRKLLVKLIDEDTLQCLGWPDEPVDAVLEKVIEQCGARAADRDKWSRVQRLRENAKHLFLYVVDDKNVARMLGTHTIDQIIKHILVQVSDDENPAVEE